MAWMKRSVRWVALPLSFIFLAGCATIMQGTTQSVGISSTPTGASVMIDGAPHGKTPVVAKLSRKDNHLVKIEMPGYQPYEINLVRKTGGWVWGNIVFGGLIGLVIDSMSGGLYKLEPGEINAALQKGGVSSLYKDGNLFVVLVSSPDPSWEKIGALERK